MKAETTPNEEILPENEQVTEPQQVVESTAEGDTAAEQPTAEVPETDPVAALEAKVADYDDRYKRLFAEFDNFRRRTARERLELEQQANARLLKTLIPVLDDMERAVKSFDTTEDVAVLREGVTLVHNKFLATMEKAGVKAIDSRGLPFDAEVHEAVTQIPAPSEELTGKVVDELEKGYNLFDKVLRFAKVIIGA